MINADDDSDRVGSPFPEPMEPPLGPSSPDQPSLSRRISGQNLGVNDLASPLSKQKSTPNLGMGQPSLLKTALKSKSIANLQNNGGRNPPTRSTSAAGSYLTVESFQTAHDDEDGYYPPSPAGTVPQITLQLPSNNPSSTSLAGESSSEAEEFFDGEEGPGGDDDEGGRNINKGNEGHQPRMINGGHSHKLGDEGNGKASAPGDNSRGPRDVHASGSYSLSSGSDSGSDNESEAETRSNHTEMDRTLVTTVTDTSQMRHMDEGTGVTLIPEMVAVALKTSSPDSVKASVGRSRTTVIEA